ncbi:baculoviral IAP repeat-containing protein 7-A-like [Argopecten irradians]|uniref:baculoviral IAP repeat-containing protein 7-A-like n=1 Tax=Argopecten irradians TaxID=31199 RepID=UPI003716A917
MDIAPPLPSERYKHLRDPELRIRSFRKWQKYSEPFLRELVDEGFFGIDEQKRTVQCVYCGGVLCGIAEGQNVHITHYRHFPTCDRFKFREHDFLSLFRKTITSNGEGEPVADEMSRHVHMVPSKVDRLRTGDESYFDGRDEDTSHSIYILGDTKYPKHSYYSMYIDRLKTFRNWPTHLTQKPKDLAKNGFFYTGVDDVCECYCCGGQLDCWEEEDDPQQEHDKWFSDTCPLSQTRQRRTAADVG